MATAVKPLRLDGRSSAANVEVCGWGLPPVSHHHDHPMVEALGAALHHHSTEFRFHAPKQQRGQIFSARSNADTGGIKDAEDYRTALLSDSPQVSFICAGGI